MKYAVQYGHAAVWVNNAEGCLGRFGRFGIDVHTTISAQEQGASECLFCTHNMVTSEDWPRFIDAMKKFHGIDMSDQPMPKWLIKN